MKELTKEMLQELGITDVTEDGTVYVDGKVRKTRIIVGTHSNGNNKEYPAIWLQNKKVKRDCIQKYKTKNGEVKTYPGWVYKLETIPLARVMLAWFNGKIGAKEDADHIDNDPFNNHLSNLRPISRRENLAKRFLDHPDYEYTYFNQYHNLKKKDE